MTDVVVQYKPPAGELTDQVCWSLWPNGFDHLAKDLCIQHDMKSFG